MISIRPLLWTLLFASRISAHVIPGPGSATKESEIHITGEDIQHPLHKQEASRAHSILLGKIYEEQQRNDHIVVDCSYKDDSIFNTPSLKLAKRQDDPGTSNSSISSQSTIVVASSTTTEPPSTSIVTIPPSSSTTVIIITTSPSSAVSAPVVGPTSSNPPVTSEPATSSNPAQPSVIPVSTSSTISSATVTTPASESSSSQAAATSQGSESSTSLGVVLVTSTLPDGDTTTITSYVGAPPPTGTNTHGTATSSPSGQVQNPNEGGTLRPGNLISGLLMAGVIIAM